MSRRGDPPHQHRGPGAHGHRRRDPGPGHDPGRAPRRVPSPDRPAHRQAWHRRVLPRRRWASSSTAPTATGSLTQPLTFGTTFRSAGAARAGGAADPAQGRHDRPGPDRRRSPSSRTAAMPRIWSRSGSRPPTPPSSIRFRVTTPSGIGRPGRPGRIHGRRTTGSSGGPCRVTTVTLHWYEGDDAFAAACPEDRPGCHRPGRRAPRCHGRQAGRLLHLLHGGGVPGRAVAQHPGARGRPGEPGHPDHGRQHRPERGRLRTGWTPS